MKGINISATGKFLPSKRVETSELANFLNVTEEFIISRTGIKNRFYAEFESIEYMAIMAARDLFKDTSIEKEKVDLIIVATTSTNCLMPGISYKVQKDLGITNCMCIDVLAGCAGFVNAFDMARLYVASAKCKNALVIGVDKLSACLDKKDVSTSVVLSDGAGAIFIESSDEYKFYESNIVSDGSRGDILTFNYGEFIFMNGKEIYKYAVTETVDNVNGLLKMANEDLNNIKYIVPHQANLRILDSISHRLKLREDQFFVNIQDVGNTFCASIPIALCEMFENNLLNKHDKIILLGYGGGLNTGSILMEV